MRAAHDQQMNGTGSAERKGGRKGRGSAVRTPAGPRAECKIAGRVQGGPCAAEGRVRGRGGGSVT